MKKSKPPMPTAMESTYNPQSKSTIPESHSPMNEEEIETPSLMEQKATTDGEKKEDQPMTTPMQVGNPSAKREQLPTSTKKRNLAAKKFATPAQEFSTEKNEQSGSVAQERQEEDDEEEPPLKKKKK